MARRKPREKAKPNRPNLSDRAEETKEANLPLSDKIAPGAQTPHRPNPATQRLLLGLAVAHLGLLFLSYTAVVGPSAGHSRWLSVLAPLLRTTHFGADGRPYYLAQGTPDEQPHRLQFVSLPDNESELKLDAQTQWTTIEPSGFAGFASHDHYRRWMRLVATLAESERPSLAAALLMPLVNNQSESDGPKIDAVRIIRLPTQLTTAVDDAAPPAYIARVVRSVRKDGGNDVRLVSIQPTRLTTFSQADAGESPDVDAGLGDAQP